MGDLPGRLVRLIVVFEGSGWDLRAGEREMVGFAARRRERGVVGGCFGGIC